MKIYRNNVFIVVVFIEILTLCCTVECRRAIQPPENVEDIVKRLNNLNIINNEGN